MRDVDEDNRVDGQRVGNSYLGVSAYEFKPGGIFLLLHQFMDSCEVQWPIPTVSVPLVMHRTGRCF